ncbi:MAG: class I SAM-dependent methyltransferase [Acidobacteriota bacterium]
MLSLWPPGFRRIPPEDWTTQPVERLAIGYDTVEHHGWYRNLEPTLRQLETVLQEGDLLLDYSGGTGILASRLLERLPALRFGILIVDSSPKFLRLAMEKLGQEERVAFRRIRFLKGRHRLQRVDEILDPSLLRRGTDVLVSTNAIHLYYDLPATLASWARVLKPGGMVHVQSGNIRNPAAAAGERIIDETVEAIHREAMRIVRREPAYASYREILENPRRLAAYETLRTKYFLPVRTLQEYIDLLEKAGFTALETSHATMEARVSEWREFLGVYHEGVLGWVGGAEKIEGRPASAAATRTRLELLGRAMETVFGGRPTFKACWTYITCHSASC